MELCLGTVQFGLDYGVMAKKKPDIDYSIKCLDYATQNGISAIDTATAYGNAEEVVGKFLNMHTVNRDDLFISTKFLPNILDDRDPKEYRDILCENIINSLRTLNTDYVDAYYLHSSRYAFNPEILDALQIVKEKGYAKKVGVSVYYPDEAKECFKRNDIDIIQAPYSIFDHRMKEEGVFDKENCKGCEIQTRTAFIKGLIHYDVNDIPDHLAKAKPIIEQLDLMCKETGYSRVEIAMGYVKREPTISHLVFGIRNLEQLKEDIEGFEKDIPDSLLREIDEKFSGMEADLVVPSLWKK